MSQIAEWLVDGLPLLLLLLLLLYYNEVEREKKFDFDILRGNNKVVNKKYTNNFFLITKRKTHTHTHAHTHTRTLLTNNNAERGIVCSQERRRRARASERYDQTMRGDARRERWFCYIKSYLKLFCVLYLGPKNLVPETRAHQDD